MKPSCQWTGESGSSLPLIVEFQTLDSTEELTGWYGENKDRVDAGLLRNGAVLFRNLPIHSTEDFDRCLPVFATSFMRYVDGFSPRTRLSGNIYTSTEYDADFFITLHNELSYSARWPERLFFSCIIPPATGGETAIADGRRVVGKMNPDLLEEMERKGVRYVRNLHAGGGPGPSWQQTYETEDRTVVENFCRASQIEFTWKQDGGIKLVQHRPATITHPVTAEKVWFNQVDQFHPSHFMSDVYETLLMMYDYNEEELPMFGTFGDGSKISDEAIKEIRETVDSEIVLNPWKQGDLLMVDNVLVSHGRMPYKGARKILVSMS
jgi:alpha-ketoglutarate-dependent taurine dioxygenase